MIKASALKSCRKNQPFFYTLMQEKIAAVFLETLDNNQIKSRTKIRYNRVTIQGENFLLPLCGGESPGRENYPRTLLQPVCPLREPPEAPPV